MKVVIDIPDRVCEKLNYLEKSMNTQIMQKCANTYSAFRQSFRQIRMVIE